VLTEQRDEEVDLADLLDRLRAMLIQDVGVGREITVDFEPVLLPGTRATALALVFSELVGNALEHGGAHIKATLGVSDGEVLLAVIDDGPGLAPEPRRGTGLSIVRALVRDELRGSLELISDAGMRAEVRFPA
jgi:two-component sensor histidine kinase